MDELIPTRATLLHRLKDWRDDASWQVFFDTYWRLIYRVALRGGLTEVEAQDVVQETMASVAKQMPGFKYDPAIGSFKAWLLNMTRWRIVDHLRKRGPAPTRHLAPEDTAETNLLERVMDPNGNDLERLWNAEWGENLLEAAMAKAKRKVDPQRFQMFDLYVSKCWDATRVADAFGVPVGQVYLAKHRVTEVIKEEVRRLELEVT